MNVPNLAVLIDEQVSRIRIGVFERVDGIVSLLLPIGEVVAVVVFEAYGLGEELLHHAFLVVLQQGFLLDQLPNPPIHRRQEIRDLPLFGQTGHDYLELIKFFLPERSVSSCSTWRSEAK